MGKGGVVLLEAAGNPYVLVLVIIIKASYGVRVL
jgi:hypothetical protein